MNVKKWLVLALSISFVPVVQAEEVPQSKSEFCSQYKSMKGNRTQVILGQDEMRMAFQNNGGLINGGVCWWHSRFQRNAAYLTIFRPDLPIPSSNEAKEIIKDIRFATDVITIPGFANFNEFSRYFRAEIQSRLDGWQRTDGFLKQQWIVGLAGASETTQEKMKKGMDNLYKQVSQGDVVYQKLQIKGIVAHAWLVIGMTKVANGYDLEVIDSNSPVRTQAYRYREGDTSFYHYYYGNFVPYTGHNRELNKLKKKVKKFCK